MVFRTEREFQRWVCKTAMEKGWMVYCHPDSRKTGGLSTKGFPDVVLLKGAKLVFLELKRKGRFPEPEQMKWNAAIRGATIVTSNWADTSQAHVVKKLLEG